MAAKKPTKIETVEAPAVEAPPAPKHYDWRDPDATFADDDNSIDARMWRLDQEHKRMAAHPQ